MLGGTVPSIAGDLAFLSPRKSTLRPLEYLLARILPFLIFLQLAPWAELGPGVFGGEGEKICATQNSVLLALSLLSIERKGNRILRTGI